MTFFFFFLQGRIPGKRQAGVVDHYFFSSDQNHSGMWSKYDERCSLFVWMCSYRKIFNIGVITETIRSHHWLFSYYSTAVSPCVLFLSDRIICNCTLSVRHHVCVCVYVFVSTKKKNVISASWCRAAVTLDGFRLISALIFRKRNALCMFGYSVSLPLGPCLEMRGTLEDENAKPVWRCSACCLAVSSCTHGRLIACRKQIHSAKHSFIVAEAISCWW